MTAAGRRWIPAARRCGGGADGVGRVLRAELRQSCTLSGGPASVREAEGRQSHHGYGCDEGGDRGVHRDLAHLPEGVGVQQQAAKGLTAEGGLHLLGELLVVRV